MIFSILYLHLSALKSRVDRMSAGRYWLDSSATVIRKRTICHVCRKGADRLLIQVTMGFCRSHTTPARMHKRIIGAMSCSLHFALLVPQLGNFRPRTASIRSAIVATHALAPKAMAGPPAAQSAPAPALATNVAEPMATS